MLASLAACVLIGCAGETPDVIDAAQARDTGGFDAGLTGGRDASLDPRDATDAGSGADAEPPGPDAGSGADAGAPEPDASAVRDAASSPDAGSADGGTSPPPACASRTPVPGGAIVVRPGDALQQKLDACNGGTLHFTAGTYDVHDKLHVRSGCTLLSSGATLRYAGSILEHAIFELGSNTTGVRIEGFTFSVRGIKVESGSRIVIHGNVFEQISGNAFTRNSIFAPLGISSSAVTCNQFVRSPAGEGMYSLGGATFVDTRVTDNVCDDVIECVHLLFSTSSRDVEVSRNAGRRIKRIFIELQGGPDRLMVADNSVSDWVRQGNPPNDSHMALSIATGEGRNITIARNVLVGSGDFPTDPATVNYSAIEVMGDAVRVEDNRVSNWGCATLNTSYGPTGCSGQPCLRSWTTRNNTWCHIRLQQNPPDPHCGDVRPASSTGDVLRADRCD